MATVASDSPTVMRTDLPFMTHRSDERDKVMAGYEHDAISAPALRPSEEDLQAVSPDESKRRAHEKPEPPPEKAAYRRCYRHVFRCFIY